MAAATSAQAAFEHRPAKATSPTRPEVAAEVLQIE
jgi:hypothetical protein